MRIFVFITLIFSMAVSPAVALASCASMGEEAGMMEMADAGAGPQMSMGAMGADDCDNMKGEKSQSHDAGCAAACALICPGFYSGPEPTADNGLAFKLVQYAIPPAEPGLATPSHVDPPPPRI